MESEKLANELESLKVNDDSKKSNVQVDKQEERSGEGTSTEAKKEAPVEDTKKESDTEKKSENVSENSENPPESSDKPPENSDNPATSQ